MGSVSRYAYLNAKLRTRLATRVSDTVLTAMLRAPTLEEAALPLKETRFKAFYEAYEKTGDLRLAEVEIARSEIELFSELAIGLPRNVREFVTALALKVEVDNVKTLLRLWFSRVSAHKDGVSPDEFLIRQKVVYEINYDAVLAANDIEDVVRALRGSPYAVLAANNAAALREDRSIFKLEEALDFYYYDRLNRAIVGLDPEDRRYARKYIGNRIDIENLLCQTRYKKYGLLADEALKYFIRGGRRLTKEACSEIGGREEQSAAKLREWYPQAPADSDFLTLAERCRNIEAELDGQSALGDHPFSSAVLIAYFYLMQDNIRKVQTALHSRFYGIGEEEARKML